MCVSYKNKPFAEPKIFKNTLANPYPDRLNQQPLVLARRSPSVTVDDVHCAIGSAKDRIYQVLERVSSPWFKFNLDRSASIKYV
jgi:hypothetical protein